MDTNGSTIRLMVASLQLASRSITKTAEPARALLALHRDGASRLIQLRDRVFVNVFVLLGGRLRSRVLDRELMLLANEIRVRANRAIGVLGISGLRLLQVRLHRFAR